MKKIKIDVLHCILIIAPFLLSFLLFRKEHIKVYMIGDSTMCQYGAEASPVTGWGMPFANFFDSSVTVKNDAQSGRSTRTFIEDRFWQPIADSLNAGDYVLIQFGHNDEVPTKKSYTNEKDFKKNLIRFITESRNKGANPLLITPVARRKFNDSGVVQETHAVYSALVRNIAQEYSVPLIDLDKKGQKLLQDLGPEKSKFLFNYLDPGENPHFPKGNVDNTHFNELGAMKIAEIVLAEIRALKLELANRIFKPENEN